MKIIIPREEEETGRARERRREAGRQRELSGWSVCLGDARSGCRIVWRWSRGRTRGKEMKRG